jgi:phosphoglucomutase/phosphomannomutase
MTTAKLLHDARNGFRTLDIQEKYRQAALEFLETWLTVQMFADYVPQIEYLIQVQKWELLLDSFYKVISFGTGGRRGLVGIGPNRINTWTIQASAQGHSQYLIKQHGEEAAARGVVLTYDVRKYTQQGIYDPSRPNPVMNLDGRKLAEAAAEVYAANGIKVFLFREVRSTPELSFAIRHLKAIAGDMFSASHNLPTDNGKKVYDRFGGQLIPPHDQTLVDEVSQRVSEIRKMNFEAACTDGLVQFVGEQLDNAYHEAAQAVSLSDARDLKIVYSPLHGTGLTSVYPILRKLEFDLHLDPQTANLSGAFENVTFNIPNPEVVESFDPTVPYADKIGADLIINTDPDADRIGVMLKHAGNWKFLTGNEIGIILTHYAISKLSGMDRLTTDSIVIKTEVTSALIEKIARENGVRCIGDLLVGFKYIAEEMNQLEADHRIDRFILGTEESHGYITGNYARDKDAACAAIWICEHAAELKASGKTLLDDLNDIYARYGYCHNYLTEIRLLGAKGMDQILHIMEQLRNQSVESFGDFAVSGKIDRWQGPPQPHLSETDTSARNVLIFRLEDRPDTRGIRITVRPSGTEPKIKMYFEIIGKPCRRAALDSEKRKISDLRFELEKLVMDYCYRLIGVDFPERGYLLFWQLPLQDKLTYFEIEEQLAALKRVSDPRQRHEKLYQLLDFLGANPIEKVDKAFQAKYEKSIHEYLGLNRP